MEDFFKRVKMVITPKRVVITVLILVLLYIFYIFTANWELAVESFKSGWSAS